MTCNGHIVKKEIIEQISIDQNMLIYGSDTHLIYLTGRKTGWLLLFFGDIQVIYSLTVFFSQSSQLFSPFSLLLESSTIGISELILEISS